MSIKKYLPKKSVISSPDEDLLNSITVEDIENILYEKASTSEGRKELVAALRTFDKESIKEPIIQTVLVSMAADHGENTYDLIVNESESSINGEEMFHDHQRVLGNQNAIKSTGAEPGSVTKARATIRSSSNSPSAARNAEKEAAQAASRYADPNVPQMGGPPDGDDGDSKCSENSEYHESEKDRNSREALAAVEFGDDIRVLLINAVDMRIICHFLSCQSVNDIKNAPYNNVPMIGLMLMECLVEFMRSKGYSFSGEIDFDNEGNPIPTTKQTWILLEEEHTFTRKGYMFFKHESGDRKENVVFYNFSNLIEGQSGLTAFSNTPIKSKNLISELELYTKENNCIRGTKLRDVDMIHAKFEEVTGLEGYSFEKYYYQQYIRDIFDMEVFGFLDNIEEYNSLGIDKRGVMTYGPPGTGKTTLGKIICNKAGDKTVIWVTPDLIAENTQSKHAIKLLYMLADFVSPSALLLEDIDLWANDRDDMGDTLRLGALMNILDGVNSIKNCVTIAMTNRIELIEKALRNRPGRFDVIVEIPALIKVLRERMLKDRLFNIQVDDDVIPYVLQESEGWTGAYVQHFVHTANMYFVYHKVPKHLTLDVAKNVLGTIKKFTYRERGEESLGFK